MTRIPPRINVHFMKSTATVVPCILALTMANSFIPVSPMSKAGINIVLVRIDQRACSNRGRDERLNRLLPDVLQHANDHAAAPLNHAQPRRLFLLQRTPAASAF